MIIDVIKKNKLLFLVLMLYMLAIIFTPHKALESFNNSFYYIKEMALIMPLVLVVTTLIETWVPKQVIIKNLGEQSGFKGIAFSFILGSVSAGPIYAAFPICQMLFTKGASVLNIVIILSSWAVIKIPMLINEYKFLGMQFMITRWLLTVVAIMLIAFFVSKTVKRADIKASGIVNKANISTEYCVKCGVCITAYPHVFQLSNGKVKFADTIQLKEYAQQIKDAAKKCPVKAINYDL